MFKSKIIFPTQSRLHSPYQLEDCQRRLRQLQRGTQPIHLTQLDDDTVQFRIRRVKSDTVAMPMIAFEICGTLCRWGGTGTVIKEYRLKRLTARIDTWVIVFVVGSLLVSLGLMLPALINIRDSLQMGIVLLFMVLMVGLVPFVAWARQTQSLNIERDIDALHRAILHELSIASHNEN